MARFRPALEALEDRTFLATLTVQNTNDSGPDSLRALIDSAAAGDVIAFNASVAGQTITLSRPIAFTTDLTVRGLSADRLTVSGNNTTQLFRVSPGVHAALSGLRLFQGAAVGAGGGAIDNDGTLTMDGVWFDQNTSRGGNGGSFGGGGPGPAAAGRSSAPAP